jgi:hypothetical protein
MKNLFVLFIALLCFVPRPAHADRWTSLVYARYLTITTKQGASYFYLASSTDATVMQLSGTQVIVARDTFDMSDIKSMRIKEINKFVLDEDSTRFGGNYAVTHGMLALRRTLTAGQWNSIVLPVNLTGQQVRDAFGDDAMLASVRGFREGSDAIVDYETIALDTDNEVMKANLHYIIRPTREPDLAADKKGLLNGTQMQGPFYLIPDVSMAMKQIPKSTNYRHENGSLAQRGTYTIKDGSSVLNKKLYDDAHAVYLFGDDGLISQQTDSVLVRAFSSWFIDLAQQLRQLRFYIDGISEDLTAITPATTNPIPLKSDDRIFDLQGRLMGNQQSILPKGIYVRNGRKFIIK